MVIGFKKEFKEPIRAGAKIHTIRLDEHDRWHAGVKMHMATGVRTKHYDCFREDVCRSTQEVFMSLSKIGHLEISVDDRYLYMADKQALAFNDGFKTVEDFREWFAALLVKEPNQSKRMKLIHWTDKRY